MATPSPYTRPAPIRCKCVANRTTKKAVSYNYDGEKIKIQSFNVKTVSALSDGTNLYTSTSLGRFSEFEEGVTYFLKNVTVSAKYGRQNLYFGRTSSKFRAAPLALSDAAEKAAKDILCPPSHPITGEEADIFSRGDYLSIQGQVEKVSYFNVVNELSGNKSALLCCLNEDENEESLLITHPHEVANPYD